MPEARHRRTKLFAEMNMIPMIDISLIILIIFMVLTPMLVHTQLSVKLPKATSPDAKDGSKTIQIEISKKGRYTVDGKRVKKSRLRRELELKLSKASSKRVLVQADRSVAVQHVVDVLDIAKSLGVGALGIGVVHK